MTELAKARKALEDALDELAAAAAANGAGGGDDALKKAVAERAALEKQLAEMRAARIKDAAMIEDALADLRAIA